MKRKRVYIDTSVLGGYYDKKFETASRALIDSFFKGEMIAVISELTLEELDGAPGPVKALPGKIKKENVEFIHETPESLELSEKYIKAGLVTKKTMADAKHIALATSENVDVLVSWNFKHIVNINRIAGFNAVNMREGYKMLEIRSPLEVIDG